MYSNQALIELVDILRAEDTETEWLEFKSNYLSNQDIGEYISALSNGAALRADRLATSFSAWTIQRMRSPALLLITAGRNRETKTLRTGSTDSRNPRSGLPSTTCSMLLGSAL